MRLLVFQCGVEPFRCTGVGDGKLTCSGELRAAVLTSGRRSASASKSWPSSRGWCHLPRRLPRRHHRPPPPESPIMPPPAPPSPSPPTFADLRADYESSAPQTAGSVASFASPSGLGTWSFHAAASQSATPMVSERSPNVLDHDQRRATRQQLRTLWTGPGLSRHWAWVWQPDRLRISRSGGSGGCKEPGHSPWERRLRQQAPGSSLLGCRHGARPGAVLGCRHGARGSLRGRRRVGLRRAEPHGIDNGTQHRRSMVVCLLSADVGDDPRLRWPRAILALRPSQVSLTVSPN